MKKTKTRIEIIDHGPSCEGRTFWGKVILNPFRFEAQIMRGASTLGWSWGGTRDEAIENAREHVAAMNTAKAARDNAEVIDL